MKYYGEKKLTESKIPEPFANIKDDFLQVNFQQKNGFDCCHSSRSTVENYLQIELFSKILAR